MKITRIEPVAADRFLFVQIYTDSGIVGTGESGTWGFLEASRAALVKFADYLIGKDPLLIEHHWQYMYRAYHFRGAAIMGALSALDIALWDIAGKHFGVPVYQLLGGKTRNKARVYHHVFGDTTEHLVAGCIRAKEAGFTAVGHLTPFLDQPRGTPYFETYAELIDNAADRVRQYREAVGNEVDLCIEIHRRLNPHEAISLGRAIETYRPYFFEDPIKPDNIDAMEEVAKKIGIPIATGERLHTLGEFKMILSRGAARYVRPDVCMVGGITHAKKIAALAEAFEAQVVPHNPLSPVSTAACVQIAAAIPNFAIQEYPGLPDGGARGDKLVTEPLLMENGFLVVPDNPGIGVELVEAVAEKFPVVPRPIQTRLHEDGSVVDQ